MASPTERQKLLVGVVGGAASGKDTVAELFTRHGYVHVSSSDLVREEIARRGQVTSRELQTAVANELRLQHGPGYWVDLSLQKLGSTPTKAVISGLYSPGEGEALIEEHGGVLVSVVAGEGDDSQVRFNRLKSRNAGARDALSIDEFMAAHTRENSGLSPHETNLGRLHNMAKFVIYNTIDINYLEEQTAAVVSELERSN